MKRLFQALRDRIRPRRAPPPHEALLFAPARPSSITVWGFLNSEIGLGASARGLVQALDSIGGNVQRYALPLAGRDHVAFRTSRSIRRARRNIIVVNPPELTSADFAFPHDYLKGSHRIAYWAWELERTPDFWGPAFDLVDEIWTCSTFSAAALRRATGKPVHVVPHLVEDWAHAPRDAARAGLPSVPQGGFLFLFVFDFQSGFARKNPLGVVDAFLRAFGNGPTGPHLVLKYHSAAGFPEEEARLRDAASRCPRISLVAEVFSQAQMHALHDAADCFVSLHRAEGFGLAIAEAMIAGKPVICTGHSGSMDFTDPARALLIGYTLRDIAPSDYAGAEGQSWAEPDIGEAVAAMRRIAADPAFARELGRRGRDHALALLGKPAVAGRVKALLATSART